MFEHDRSRRLFVIGGFVSSLVLVGFGIGMIVIGFLGRADVRDTLAEENIVGTPDSEIPGQLVDSGSEAKAMARIIRTHALAASGGQTYSEMPQYLDADGQPTNDREAAALDDQGQPVQNPQRETWVTATALTTALNTAYFAEQVGLFAMVTGVALLLTGVGFSVLTAAALLFRRPAQDGRTSAA